MDLTKVDDLKGGQFHSRERFQALEFVPDNHNAFQARERNVGDSTEYFWISS